MLLNNHPTADIIIQLIRQTVWARRIHLNQGVRWLFYDDAARMNKNAYGTYVISTSISPKRHVKNISEVQTLAKMFYRFNRDLIIAALARDFILKYAYDDYDSDSDEQR